MFSLPGLRLRNLEAVSGKTGLNELREAMSNPLSNPFGNTSPAVNAALLGGAGSLVPGAAQAEPRKAFSANAFRNLATRLKPAEAPPPAPAAWQQPQAPEAAFAASSLSAPPAPALAEPVSASPPQPEEAKASPAFGDVAQDKADAETAKEMVERELETIWRMLLARPTKEDLEIFLAEAAEIMADDPLYEAPPPELPPEPLSEEDEEQSHESGTMVRSLQSDEADVSTMSELARALLDLMASGSGLPQERSLAADTLLRMVPKLDLPTLKILSARLSIMENPPPLLVAWLIRDPQLEVSAPLLENCNFITEPDLQTVVAAGEPAKLALIARRRHISGTLSDALIAAGDGPAMLQLLRNEAAVINHDGFVALLKAAASDHALLAPLVNRKEISAAHAFEAFWLCPPELRRLVLSRFLTDSEALGRILRITLSTRVNSGKGRPESSSQIVLLEALERAIRGNIGQAVTEIANALQLKSSTVMRILKDSGGEPLIVLLKAAGYPRSAVPGLLVRINEASSQFVKPERSVDELQSMFETLSSNKARILLIYWDWAQARIGPYAPVN